MQIWGQGMCVSVCWHVWMCTYTDTIYTESTEALKGSFRERVRIRILKFLQVPGAEKALGDGVHHSICAECPDLALLLHSQTCHVTRQVACLWSSKDSLDDLSCLWDPRYALISSSWVSEPLEYVQLTSPWPPVTTCPYPIQFIRQEVVSLQFQLQLQFYFSYW